MVASSSRPQTSHFQWRLRRAGTSVMAGPGWEWATIAGSLTAARTGASTPSALRLTATVALFYPTAPLTDGTEQEASRIGRAPAGQARQTSSAHLAAARGRPANRGRQ